MDWFMLLIVVVMGLSVVVMGLFMWQNVILAWIEKKEAEQRKKEYNKFLLKTADGMESMTDDQARKTYCRIMRNEGRW